MIRRKAAALPGQVSLFWMEPMLRTKRPEISGYSAVNLAANPLSLLFVVLHVGGGNDVVEMLGESVGIPGGETGGGDGIAHDHQQRTWHQVISVDRQEFVGSNESERNERKLCLDGHIGCA